MQSNQFFATEKPVRLFCRVAFPGMVSMLAMSIYSVIEGIFIGQLLGEVAFAAVNVAMPFVMINFSLADMMGVGSSVPISIALGRKDAERANNYFTCSIFLILAAAVLVGGIIFCSAPALVRLMGAQGELADLSIRYVRVFAALGPVTTLVFAMDNYLRVCGFMRGSMVLNIFMSLLTLGLLIAFLMLMNMNVEGSALATCLAMTACALIAFIPFVRGKAQLKLVRPRFSLSLIREVVACGAPTFLNNIAGRVAAIIMNVALLRLGGATAMAAYSVLMYASDILQPILYGLSDSMQPVIGYNWGARSLSRVRDLTKCVLAASAVVSVLGTAAMYFFPRPISALFVAAEDTALLSLCVHAMKLFCIAYLFRWFGFAVQGFYSAIEKPLAASVLSVASALVFPMLLVFLLSPMGLDGLWLNMAGMALGVSVLAVFMLLRSQKHMKRDIEA